MKKITVGIIGCGTIASNAHISSYLKNENVIVKYFCDILPEKVKAAVDLYGTGIAVTDYKEILADEEVDAVSICTPNHLHAKISIEAMWAGKHVLCEKPAARTYQEVKEMQEAQHETGKILNIGVVNRFGDYICRIRNYIQEGRLGDVYHVYMSFRSHRAIPGLGGAFTTRAISGGGVLIDWGVHFLDLVMYCLDEPKPLTVSGETFCRLGKDIESYRYRKMWAGPPRKNGTYDVEDSVTALIRTEGPTFTLHGAWAQNVDEDEMFIDFMGDKGGIRLRYGGDFTLYTVEHGEFMEFIPEGNAGFLYENEIDDFVESIIGNKKSKAHIDSVALTARIMQAIYDSAACHREVVF